MKYSIFLFSLLFLLIIASCTDDEPICINTSAAFKIEQVSVFYPGQEMECNICLAQDLVFTVLDSTITTVKWTIGNDPRTFEGQSVQLDFRGNEGHTFTVTCMVERDLTTSDICIGDNGIDTFSQSVQLIEPEEATIYGKYEGYIESNPSDVFTIELFYKDTIDNSNAQVIARCGGEPFVYNKIISLPQSCNNLPYKCWYPKINATNDKFYFQKETWSETCQQVTGYGYLESDDRIIITYQVGRFDNRTQYQFLGNRIN